MIKLPFVLLFFPLRPFNDVVPQRVPNVPSDFLTTKHRFCGPQSIA